jgi:hypothetical protein
MSSIAPTGLDSKSGATVLLPKIPVTHTSLVPVNTAIHLNKKNDGLHKLSIPFAYQFAFRYLFGMDLEFDEEKIKAAKGYAKDGLIVPQYTIMVSVGPSKRNEKTVAFYEPEINRELYAEISDVNRE